MPVIDMVKIEREHPGEWVALSDDRKRVVATGATPQEVLKKARQAGVRDPILTKVPRESLEYLL